MTRSTRVGPWAVVLVLALTACGGGRKPGTGDPATETFAPALGIDLAQMTKTSSGLYVQDVTVGTGDEAAAGSKVTVDYTGWFTDGKSFDSGSFPFTVGQHEVVPGFEEGVTGMKVGGVRKLVIPPALGYGAAGTGPIPGNTVLVFRVTLKSVS